MAKTKKEEVVESTTQENITKETTTQEQPKVDNEIGKLKVKKPKIKKFKQSEEEIIKIDLDKPPKTEEDADTKQETTDVASDKQAPVIEEVVEEVPQGETTIQDEDTPIVEEITKEQKEIEDTKQEVVKAVEEAETTGNPLPEGVEKLMKFMDETGGDLEDYVKLNRDTSKLDDQDILYEYYKQTKPHLNNEEINFLMKDEFEYDEEND